ncbi:hypothetical protein BC835DRAFT_1368186 [Cytidiella melzeri]|nr:hypothetical protein BC835DRAFT_1368186 [Cytidiella melzeri]
MSFVKEEAASENGEVDLEGDEQSRLLDITCRIEQCRSKDEVVSLETRLKEANERIEDLEQVLQESAARHEMTLEKYDKVKTKSQARRETVQQLRKQLQELEVLQAQDEQSPLPGASEDQHPQDEEGETVVVSPSQPPVSIPLKWLTEPCLLRSVDVPFYNRIAKMARAGGKYLCMDRCSVDTLNGTAISYTPQTSYKRGMADENQRWILYNQLDRFKGGIREIFHVVDGNIHYAGTFEASKDMGECSREEYQAFSYQLRQSLLAVCVVPAPEKPPLTDAENLAIVDRYWSGQSKVRYLTWKRIGFNTMLYQAILAQQAVDGQTATKEQTAAESSQTRKSVEDHGGSSKKKKA